MKMVHFIFDAIYAFENLVVRSLEWIVGVWVFASYELARVFWLYDAAHPSRSFVLGTLILVLIGSISYTLIRVVMLQVQKNSYQLNYYAYDILLTVIDGAIVLLVKLRTVVEKERMYYKRKLDRKRKFRY